ncbi:kinetochore-microtubule binding complex subunit SPC105 [Saccharomyces eubayanus]|uniref:kinetochore-microtubule binding complex subunit SPC105 n=1 Tax=Saccharomyces eubayanus TaxID=1080349 RepID=UPI0006C618A3|nr:SPC105-like protein [Saccharomyces eubayanus]KOG99427.1 SPC105-like protein [Saccharomyces eubayanus]
MTFKLDDGGGSAGKDKDAGPGKGILKQNSNSQMTANFLESSGIRIPTRIMTKKDVLDGNNTTSRINTSNLQSKANRRVSFAPDVTLHSFTFVPEQSNEAKEPRRRKPTNNSPTKKFSQDDPFVTSTQIDDVRRQETDVNEDAEASGMEFTEPLLTTRDFNKVSQDDLTSMEMTDIFPQSMRPEGPDIGGNMNESSQQVDEAENIREETMELTGIHYVHNLGDTLEETDEGEPIELTAYETNPFISNSAVKSSNHDLDKSDGEEKGAPKPENQMNSSQPMEMTEVFHSDIQGDVDTSDDGNEMELTQIQTRSNHRSPRSHNEELSYKKHMATPNKRRKLDAVSHYAVSVTTPDKDGADENDLEMMEKMSPITFSDVDNKVGTKSHRPPTTESDVKNVDIEINNVYPKDAEGKNEDGNKVPELIEPPETDKRTQADMVFPTQDYSLREFIDEVGVGFLDTKLIDDLDKTVNFPLNRSNLTETQRIENAFSAYYIDIPILEVEAFRCKELWRSVNESKNKFKDFEAQIDQSHPPLLLQEYFSSSNEIKQLMRDQLQLVKGYSKLEAAMEWYEWRKKQLNGLELVLAENLSILKGECDKLNEELGKVNAIKDKIRKLNESITEEIRSLKNSPSGSYKPTLMNRIKIEAFKRELIKHSISLRSSDDLTQEMRSIKLTIANKSRDLLTLRNEVAAIDKKMDKRILFTRFDIPKLRDSLKILESLTGVRFLKFSKATLSVEFLQLDNLRVDVNLTTLRNDPIKSMNVINDNKADSTSYYFFRILLQSVEPGDQENVFSNLFIAMKKWSPLLKYIKLLKLLFPVKIVESEHHEALLQFKDYDRRNKNAVFYCISLSSFAQGIFSENGQIPVKVRITSQQDYSPSRDVLSDRIIHKISGILPSFTKSRIHLEFT